MKKIPVLLIFVLLCLSVGLNLIQWRNVHEDEVEVAGTYLDTVLVEVPVPVDSVVVSYVTERLPRKKPDMMFAVSVPDSTLAMSQADSKSAPETDSVDVEIPITQKVFEQDSLYKAYISGFRVNLDSLYVYPKTEKIHICSPTKLPRFSIGLQAGYGMTPKGFQPYIGAGITVNLWSR